MRRRLRASTSAPATVENAPIAASGLEFPPVNGSEPPVVCAGGIVDGTVAAPTPTDVVDVVEGATDVVVPSSPSGTVVVVVTTVVVVVVVVVVLEVVVVLDGGSSVIVTSFDPVAATVACEVAYSAVTAKWCAPGSRPAKVAVVAGSRHVSRGAARFGR